MSPVLGSIKFGQKSSKSYAAEKPLPRYNPVEIRHNINVGDWFDIITNIEASRGKNTPGVMAKGFVDALISGLTTANKAVSNYNLAKQTNPGDNVRLIAYTPRTIINEARDPQTNRIKQFKATEYTIHTGIPLPYGKTTSKGLVTGVPMFETYPVNGMDKLEFPGQVMRQMRINAEKRGFNLASKDTNTNYLQQLAKLLININMALPTHQAKLGIRVKKMDDLSTSIKDISYLIPEFNIKPNQKSGIFKNTAK